MNNQTRILFFMTSLLSCIITVNADETRACGNICNPILELTSENTGYRVLNGTSFLQTDDHVWLSVGFSGTVVLYEFNPDDGSVSEHGSPLPLPSKLVSAPNLVYNGTQAYMVIFGGSLSDAPNGYILVYPFDVNTGTIDSAHPTYQELNLPYYYYAVKFIQDKNNVYFACSGGSMSGQEYTNQFIKIFSFDFNTGKVSQTDERTLPQGSFASGCGWFNENKKYLVYGDSGLGNFIIYAFDMASGKLGAIPTDTVSLPQAPYPSDFDFLPYSCRSYLAVSNGDLSAINGVLQIFIFDPVTGKVRHTPCDELYIPSAGGQILSGSWSRFNHYFGAVGINTFIGLYLFNPVTGKLSPEPVSEFHPYSDYAQSLNWYNGRTIYMLAGGSKVFPLTDDSGFMNLYKVTPKDADVPCCRTLSDNNIHKMRS